MWLLYLSMTIVASYLLPSEILYSRPMRNSFIIFWTIWDGNEISGKLNKLRKILIEWKYFFLGKKKMGRGGGD